MHSSTYKKYKHLSRYLKRNLAALKNRYPDIVGAHVYFKTKEGKRMNRYAIVFHVKRKNKKKNEKANIPKYIYVSADHKKKLRVPTDVIESGTARLHVRPGAWVYSKGFSNEAGTCGLIIPFTNGTPAHLVTSMHVIGHSYLKNNLTHPDTDEGVQTIPVLNEDKKEIGHFKRGIFNSRMDAAIALINNNEPSNPVIPGIGLPKGVRELKQIEVPASGYPVMVRSRTIKKSQLMVCEMNCSFPSPVPAHHGALMMRDLLAMKRFTVAGDSGAAIMNLNQEVVGIVVGGDKNFTYGIPINRILITFGIKL